MATMNWTTYMTMTEKNTKKIVKLVTKMQNNRTSKNYTRWMKELKTLAGSEAQDYITYYNL